MRGQAKRRLREQEDVHDVRSEIRLDRLVGGRVEGLLGLRPWPRLGNGRYWCCSTGVCVLTIVPPRRRQAPVCEQFVTQGVVCYDCQKIF